MRYITTLEEDSDIILNGDRCITNLRELYTVLLQKDTTEIVMKSDFVNNYFTADGLVDFVEQASIVNPNCIVRVDEVLPLFLYDRVEQLRGLRNREELMYALQVREDEIMSTISMLCEYYLSAHKENVSANNKIATLHLLNTKAERKNLDLQEQMDSLTSVKNEYKMKLETLVSRINYSYEKDVDSNKLTQVTGHMYDKVLYIKEVTRVHYTDTLVYYLQEILKIMYGVPCRLLVIEPYHAYNRCKMYPTCRPVYDLTKQDVFQADIVMAGFQPKLMEAVLHNPAHMNYLIVLDRGGYNVPHMYGRRIDLVYTVATVSDIEVLGFEADGEHIISYNDNTLNIPHVEAFSSMTIEERMRVYSSMPTTQKLVEMIERR